MARGQTQCSRNLLRRFVVPGSVSGHRGFAVQAWRIRMNTSRNMAREVKEWAQKDPNIRVVILTSTRANPRATVDALSDYDIEVYVEDLEPFLDNGWPEVFGEILVRQPHKQELSEVKITSSPDGGRCVEGNAGCMVIYKDAPRIDFGVMLTKALKEEVKTHGGYVDDMGYEILIDKDSLTQPRLEPTYTVYNTKQPTESEYEELVHNFWWNITYVAKELYRDELFFAKHQLDGSLHHRSLKNVLAWHVGMRRNWESNPGAYGRWFKKQVEPDLWRDIEQTFAGAGSDENWEAMFKTAEVFSSLASEVGENLGYRYPREVEQGVIEYLREIRTLSDPGGGDVR